jgi:hypothetical protein
LLLQEENATAIASIKKKNLGEKVFILKFEFNDYLLLAVKKKFRFLLWYGIAGFARFLESCCSFLRCDLSASAASLRIFWGTVVDLLHIVVAVFPSSNFLHADK